ncbi:hypothetical protein NS14008_38155 [Nocardia seriolae]|nr:hypothetical protein NS14008_38155 [Nocardia seriolae]
MSVLLVLGWVVTLRLWPSTTTSSIGYVADPQPRIEVRLSEFSGKSVGEISTMLSYPDATRDAITLHVIPLDPAAANAAPADQVVAATCGGHLSVDKPVDIWVGVYPREAVDSALAARIATLDPALATQLHQITPDCTNTLSAIGGPRRP